MGSDVSGDVPEVNCPDAPFTGSLKGGDFETQTPPYQAPGSRLGGELFFVCPSTTTHTSSDGKLGRQLIPCI